MLLLPSEPYEKRIFMFEMAFLLTLLRTNGSSLRRQPADTEGKKAQRSLDGNFDEPS